MRYKDILFDLDGTVTDSCEGVINSVIYSLNKFGIEVVDRKPLYQFIGPPLRDSYNKYFGFEGKELEDVVSCYREYYEDKGIFENRFYSGIIELLDELNKKGFGVHLATSKPEVFARRIMKHFDTEKYFKSITGSNLDGSNEGKDEIIAIAIDKNNLTDLDNVVMIGDRKYDVFGAKKVGLDSIGILYGYGSRKEFEDAGATYIIEDVEKLKAFLI